MISKPHEMCCTRAGEKTKKQFLDKNDVKIGKAIIEDIFLEDRQREFDNIAAKSEVYDSTVNLNKWSLIDSKESKRPFFVEDSYYNFG